MKYDDLLKIIGGRPVFTSALLRAGDVDAVDLGRQLSRWVANGRLVQLRRGVYALPDTYRARRPNPFEVANLLERPSYVSLESALSHHGVIPEAVFVTTSVTTARAGEFETALGRYAYRHVAPAFFWGYAAESVGSTEVFVARPEKALLDLVYLRPRADQSAFLQELRLDTDRLNQRVLEDMARLSGKPKLMRAADNVAHLRETHGEWEPL
ncbi:MAG: type IV toxin-antitoxin system AbiEi family antitoxin domain-containing protein [Coriobacteriia bacterium]